MVLFIGAIMSVDAEMYEAAELDGANKFQQFLHIILPSIKTIVTLNVILSITGALSAFEQPYVITDGANGTATYFINMNRIAHTNQKRRSCICNGSRIVTHYFCMYDLTEIILQIHLPECGSDRRGYDQRGA